MPVRGHDIPPIPAFNFFIYDAVWTQRLADALSVTPQTRVQNVYDKETYSVALLNLGIGLKLNISSINYGLQNCIFTVFFMHTLLKGIFKHYEYGMIFLLFYIFSPFFDIF